MLKISHLTKIYKSKGGLEVKALDDVSVSFPETGMVFLIGKSGSGKSTLLNVCGGLDVPTSGEIIVKGRSSKDFTQSDFDSYRNTFVGFIFQEYNILNEFTVEENIALALELQNKPNNKDKINELLEKVDLSGFAKRKPNTLSGGQKQRIAIARALIKSPEIIMADEPTGALDSVTGKQVLETLKKLSKDTLVIVVSHDREFAETYGDRIIELKDGKIIFDVSKTHEEREEITKNISILGNTLCVKKGSKLNEKDFDEIKDFFNNSEEDIIVTKDREDVKKFKQLIRINDSGDKEVFKNTDSSKINLKEYTKEDSKFISSKLPIRHAVKIGVSSLKNKPIRLFFTIALCTVAFIMFGILSTMTFYDNEATFKETLRDSNYSFIKLNKQYQVNEIGYYNGEEEWNYTSVYDARFSKEEFNKYIEKFGNDIFTGIRVNIGFNAQTNSSNYWINQISTMAYMNENNSLRSKITGIYPTKDDEIAISSYTANAIYNNKAYDGETNKLIELSKPEEIIGKKITLNNKVYKVVGIIDSGIIDSKYDEILNGGDVNQTLRNEFVMALTDELHLAAFVTENKLKEISEETIPYVSNDAFMNHSIVTSLKQKDNYKFPEYGNASYAGYSNKKEIESLIPIIDGKNEPGDNEVVVSKNMFYQLLMEYYQEKANDGDDSAWANYDLASQLMNKGIHKEDKFVKFTNQEIKEKLNNLINVYKQEGRELKIGVKLFNENNGTTIGEVYEFIVVGVWDDEFGENMQSRVLFSDKIATELWDVQKTNLEYYTISTTKYENINSIYETIYLPFDHSEEKIETFWNIYDDNQYKDDDSKTILTSYMMENLQMVDSFISDLFKIFLYVGVALAVFAILLFSNFISVSISNKKREIGILRAVGARSIDVFKIFFSESFLITIICVILSIIGSILICNLLNQELAVGIGVAIFVFGIASILVLVIIALLTAIFATLLPVYNAAKKKPVDSIRAI